MAKETFELQFTNNFYVWLRSLLLSNNTANGETFTSNSGMPITINTLGSITCIDSTVITGLCFQYSGGGDYYPTIGVNSIPFSAFNSDNSNNYNSNSFVFGTGQKSFDKTDTSLQTPIDSGISAALGASHREEDNIGCLDYAVTMTNTTENDITIYEIGLSKNIPSATLTRSATTLNVLMARGVISEGLTIKAGQSKGITIRLSMPLV